MSSIIQNIRGLFANYKNNELVTAEEYNSNIKVLKEAIEINGKALKEQQDRLLDLVDKTIPQGTVTTKHIAEGAVTMDKLNPIVQEQLNLEEQLASFCKDYGPLQAFKQAASDFSGTLFNSCTTIFNKTLAYEPMCSMSVQHDTDEKWQVTYEQHPSDGPKSFTNNTLPSDFSIAFGDEQSTPFFFDFEGSWVVTYDLGASWNLTNKDEISIDWDYTSVFGTYARHYIDKAHSDLGKVYMRDANGDYITEAGSTNPKNFKSVFENSSKVTKYSNRHNTAEVYSLKHTTTWSQTNVRYIEFYVRYKYSPGTGARPSNTVNMKNVIRMPLDTLKDKITLNVLNAGTIPNVNTLKTTLQVPCVGTQPTLCIAAKIKIPSSTVQVPDTYGGSLEEYVYDSIDAFIHVTGYTPVSPIKDTDLEYKGDTALCNWKYTSQYNAVTEQLHGSYSECQKLDDNTWFIVWRYTVPCIITGVPYDSPTNKEYSFIDFMGNLITDGNYSFWDTLFNSYYQITHFNTGAKNVQLTLKSDFKEATIQSVCVARY